MSHISAPRRLVCQWLCCELSVDVICATPLSCCELSYTDAEIVAAWETRYACMIMSTADMGHEFLRCLHCN